MDAIDVTILKLNKEQRDELMGEAVRENDALHLRRLFSPARRCALARRGVLVDRMYSVQLTPHGEAVRERLLRDREGGLGR